MSDLENFGHSRNEGEDADFFCARDLPQDCSRQSIIKSMVDSINQEAALTNEENGERRSMRVTRLFVWVKDEKIYGQLFWQWLDRT